MPALQALFASVDAAQQEIVELLQALVRIPTINTGPRPDTGGESRACALLQAKLEPAGIPSEVLESAPGRGNLIARLGQPGARRVLLMAHTDVVPVEDERLWEHPPFEATIDRGRVYGRGADDDKADVAAYCMALVLLKRAGLEPHGEVVYLAAADEESGGRWGVGWLAETAADKIRADVALNEGSGVPIRTPQGLLYPVANAEKGRLEARIVRRGRSGHASRPWAADNPVPVLATAIDRIAAYEPEIDASHPFFRQVLQALGVEPAPTAENIDRLAEQLPPALATTFKAASRLTITPTLLAAGVKSNSIPDRASLVCDVRGLPGQDDAFVAQELGHLLRGLDVDISVDYTAVSNASPPDAPFVELIGRAVRVALGDPVEPAPRLVPALTIGFTDSRFLRPLGTQVYGFAPHHPSAEPLRAGVHGNNEFVEIETLLLRVKFALAVMLLA